jgi:Zn-dependent protease
VFLSIGGWFNGILALFNMLPLPPFDGASVLAGFSRTYYRWMHNPRIASAGFFIVLIAMFSGVGGVMGRWADRMGVDLASWVGRLGG